MLRSSYLDRTIKYGGHRCAAKAETETEMPAQLLEHRQKQWAGNSAYLKTPVDSFSITSFKIRSWKDVKAVM